MFGLDAEVVTPKVAATFTTRDLVAVPVLGEAMRQTARRVRDFAPDAKYGGTLEWTTGQTKYSAGRRRPHLHVLWKGVDVERVDDVHAVARDVWKRLTGAHSHKVEEIRTPGAAIRYVALHHLKEAQAPPPGWSGRRLWTSMGFWEGGAGETRRRAREVVSEFRLVKRCERELVDAWPEGPIDGGLFDELLSERVATAKVERSRGRMVRVREVPVVDRTTGEVRHRLVEVQGDL